MTTAETAEPTETFVEVHDEPRHRYRFQNDFAYIYDVLIEPGDETLYHRHAEDTLYVAITAGPARTTVLGEAPVQHAGSGGGACLCLNHRDHPLIHKVANIGSTVTRLIGTEVRASPPVVAAMPLNAPGHALRWENSRLRVYDLVLEPGESFENVEYGFSGLLVFLEDCRLTEPGSRTTSSHSAADWIWFDGPSRRSATNSGTTPLRAVLAEWR